MVSLEEINLNEGRSLLAIFAHPDDESIVAGGTLARHAALGASTALICATRGESGPISDETLANYENLGEVRESELRAACQILGVNSLHFLDLKDGSIASVLGTEEEEKTLEKIVRAIRELRPETIITFGPDGLYGHADHIAIGQLATKACAVAGDPQVFPQQLNENLTAHCVSTLFYATVPQGLYTNIHAQLAESDCDTHLWGIPPEQFGVPLEEITTVVDIAPFLERKIAAIRCHRTQLDDHHTFTLLTRELAEKLFSLEFFRLATNDGPAA